MGVATVEEQAVAEQPRERFHICVVNSHPIQYFAPLYRYLNADPSLKVTVLYCSDMSMRNEVDPGFRHRVKWDVDLLSGYCAMFLGARAKTRTPRGFWSLVVPEMWRAIRSGGFDAVWLHGYNYAAFVLAFAAARSKKIPVFFRCETQLGLKRSALRRRTRDHVLAYFFRSVDAFLAIGSVNAAYYESLGVPEDRVFPVPYTVDNDRFETGSTLRPDEVAAVRCAYGAASDAPVILYASKFIRRKHPDDVIRAAAILRKRGVSLHVLMVGSGEMEAELRQLVEREQLDCVSFAGFLNQSELPRVYAASDIFVLPSENEPWGLVVNEVMCAGLPVVVGREVGCAADLVKDNVNGRIVAPGDASALAVALEPLLRDRALRRRMGEASSRIMSEWNYEACRVGIQAAIAAIRQRQETR